MFPVMKESVSSASVIRNCKKISLKSCILDNELLIILLINPEDRTSIRILIIMLQWYEWLEMWIERDMQEMKKKKLKIYWAKFIKELKLYFHWVMTSFKIYSVLKNIRQIQNCIFEIIFFRELIILLFINSIYLYIIYIYTILYNIVLILYVCLLSSYCSYFSIIFYHLYYIEKITYSK